MPFTDALLAHRATDILATACRMLGDGNGGTVLLPALYCAEVADAIRDAGCAVRCYDLLPDLSAPVAPLTDAVADDVGVVVWHHPFGCYLPPPPPGARPGRGRLLHPAHHASWGYAQAARTGADGVQPTQGVRLGRWRPGHRQVRGHRAGLGHTLRAAGVGAWCWQRPMPGCTPEMAPRAWELWRRLLFVPTPEVGSPTYRLLDSLPIERWATA